MKRIRVSLFARKETDEHVGGLYAFVEERNGPLTVYISTSLQLYVYVPMSRQTSRSIENEFVCGDEVLPFQDDPVGWNKRVFIEPRHVLAELGSATAAALVAEEWPWGENDPWTEVFQLLDPAHAVAQAVKNLKLVRYLSPAAHALYVESHPELSEAGSLL